MSSKQEPVFSDIRAEDETAPPRATTSQGHTTTSAASSMTNSAAHKASTPTLIWVLIALLALLGGYLLFRTQEVSALNTQLTERLDQQASQVRELQERLSVTGENANLSVDALKIILKDQDKEIRKLWDVANKRNKSLIAGNKKAAEKAVAAVAELNKRMQTAVADEKQRATEALSAVRTEVKDIASQISQLEQAILSIPATFELQLDEQKERLNALSGRVDRLNKAPVGAPGAYDEDIRNIKRAIEALQTKVGQ